MAGLSDEDRDGITEDGDSTTSKARVQIAVPQTFHLIQRHFSARSGLSTVANLESRPPAPFFIVPGQERSMPSQVAARALIVVTLLVLAPAAAFAQASITWRRTGCRGCVTWGHGRGGQPGPHRKDQNGGDRHQRTVPHRRSAARRVSG